MNFKKKFKKSNEVYARDYKLNPELLIVEEGQLNFIGNQGKLKEFNNHSNNSKTSPIPSSKIINHNIGMDAKIKHRKSKLSMSLPPLDPIPKTYPTLYPPRWHRQKELPR